MSSSYCGMPKVCINVHTKSSKFNFHRLLSFIKKISPYSVQIGGTL